MTLHIRVDINGKVVGEVTVTRPLDTYDWPNTKEIIYRYDYTGSLGSTTNGRVWHRPMDGVTALAARTLTTIYNNRIESKGAQ